MAVDDSYTKALLHFDGTNGSTVFTDESGKTWTNGGSASISTAQKVFGASSLYNDYIYSADSDDWYNASALTVDFWFRPQSATTTKGLFQQRQDANNFYGAYWRSDGSLAFKIRGGSGGNLAVTATISFSANTWHHLAFILVPGAYKIFVNGVLKGSSSSSIALTNISGNFNIGYYNDESGVVTKLSGGWIDEFRVSNGIARWATDFTPPTKPYAPPQSMGIGLLSQGFGMF